MAVLELSSKGSSPPPGGRVGSPTSAWAVGDRRTEVVVCRGCCCGDAAKNSGIDHVGQLARLQRVAQDRPAQVLVRTTDCLGPCEQANVLVVRPSVEGRRRGGRPVLLGLVRDEGALDLVESWVAAGGPGVAPLPAALALHGIATPKPAGSNRVR